MKPRGSPLLLCLGVSALLFGAVPGRAQPASNRTFVAIDLETTGLSSRTARVVEIAAVRLRGNRILAAREWLIDPGVPIPPAAERVHGISDDMVRGRPSFAETWPEVARFLGDDVLLAHNGPFDMRFVRAECTRHALPPPANPALDTLRLARRWYPEADAHSLEALARHLELPPARAHRAGADARRTAALFMRGLSEKAPQAELDELLAVAGLARNRHAAGGQP